MDRLYIFKAEADYPLSPSQDSGPDFGNERTDLTLTMSPATQGLNEYYYAIGGKDNINRSKPLSKATFIICGKETIAPTDAAAYSFAGKKDQVSDPVAKDTF
jgi:hypothetical protein